MCVGSIRDAMGNAQAGKAASPKQDSLLIADKDGEGRPVGIGGRQRERDIMDIVDGMQTGIQIPERNRR